LTHSDLLEVLQRALQTERPALIVLAGSNGAGKTTFHELYLDRLGLPFVTPIASPRFSILLIPGTWRMKPLALLMMHGAIS
jgi:tRNA A37 threonylcarbamoyladenosine biosynthesis protein TsaE